ncbi:MAG: nuclear transport factor 2 family protein [Thermoanaerobaculia bacterium]
MRAKTFSLILLLAVLLIQAPATLRAGADAAPASPAGPMPSEQELLGLQKSLRETETAFAASVANQDWDQFASFIADEAIFVSGAVQHGKQAILDGWAVFFQEGAPKLSWKPEVVEIQDDGELGMTQGPFTIEQVGPDGAVLSQSGLFNSVWERQSDGSWKVIFDAGCPPCQGPAAADERD